MPQGRRKTPFSGKAKKEQLKAKKQPNASNQPGRSRNNFLLKDRSDDESSDSDNIRKLNFQPGKGARGTNRYALQFHKESDAEIRQRKELARHELQKVGPKQLEIQVDDYFGKEMDFPKRPVWSYDMSKEGLDAKENKYFLEYANELKKNVGWNKMSYFEMNLETWRQLWRVLEMSDIVLIIVDVRFPALMFPPSVYDYVTNTLKKHMILILNKIDLAPNPLVAAWKNYFIDKYPNLKVLLFTSIPSYNLMGQQSDKAGLLIRRRKGRIRMAAEGSKLLLDACKEIAGNKVDLSSWEQKIKEESSSDFKDDKIEIGETVELKLDTSYYDHEKFKNGILTVGCIGQPNVGKSSLMNAIMGKKVVSVSKTPGHTKHFQTIFLTPTVRLCDCPGLVFPSKVPKELQIIMGSFPIAQLREPFTTVKYLGERLDLPKLLRINHPEGDDTWSAMDICDGWAMKRGYLTAKAARLDSYRAANSLLRMALDGKICLCLAPPNYHEHKGDWEKHPDIASICWIKAIGTEPEDMLEEIDSESSLDDDIGDGDAENDTDADDSVEFHCVANKFSALTNE